VTTILKVFSGVVLGAALVSGGETPAAKSTSYRLEQPRSEIPVPAGIWITEWNLGQWQNGLLVLRAAGGPLTNKEVTNLVAADRSGKIVLQHTLWIPNAASVQTMGSAVSREHLVAVCGYLNSPSTGDTGFVQEIHPDGSVLRTISTGGFSPVNPAYDSRGDLWIAGSPRPEGDSYPAHSVLRRYRDGQLQAEVMPYASFTPKYETTPGLKSHPAIHGYEGRAFLLPLSEGVGLWSPGTHEWIEIGNDGAVLGRWQSPLPQPTSPQSAAAETTTAPPPRMWLSGLAVTSSGEVVASIHERNVRNALYRLDKASSSWQEITVTSDDSMPVGYVAGADGDTVVYRCVSGWAVSALVQK